MGVKGSLMRVKELEKSRLRESERTIFQCSALDYSLYDMLHAHKQIGWVG